jgi:hypothetical protein
MPRIPRWTEELVETFLRVAAEQVGRMPIHRELIEMGASDLAHAIIRTGGYRGWSRRLELLEKGGSTHRGRAIEEQVAAELGDAGFQVELLGAQAPYDLLVAGCVRLDVKSARWASFPRPKSGVCQGYFFRLKKKTPTCDLYVLCPVDERNQILERFFVPWTAARVVTLTLVPGGKYEKYREDLDQLARLVAQQTRMAS